MNQPASHACDLVADIGGTNARFACVHANGRIGTPATLAGDDYPGPAAAIAAFLAAEQRTAPRRAVLAVATPIRGDQVTWTNRPEWSFSIAGLKAELELDELEVINDFAALALGLPRLTADDVHQIGRGERVADAPHALIGPGTGLGVSGLIPNRDGWSAIDGEGGHVALSPVTDRERDVAARLAMRFGRVSAERALTGDGLVSLYGALAELDDQPVEPLEPRQITAAAMAGSCALCSETVELFCQLLATTAGNLALTLGARGGVYIGGGIVPKLGDLFDNSGFRARFESAGRMTGYLADIPTYVINAKYPALIGAAAALERI